MHTVTRKNSGFHHQAQTKDDTTLKVGTRLKGNARKKSCEQTANIFVTAQSISQLKGDSTKLKKICEMNSI